MDQISMHPKPKAALIMVGDSGAIFELSDCLVVKVPTGTFETDEAEHTMEQRKFEVLEKHSPIHRNILRSILRVPGATFMERMPKGDLELLLQKQQTRKESNPRQVLAVANLPPIDLAYRWMKETTSAAAWLESKGLAHGNLCPRNILIDAEDHVRICDFDGLVQIGEHLEGGIAPFARLKVVNGYGSYGKASVRTEQFALGSILYTLTRGHEPYETEDFGGPEHGVVVMQKLKREEYPPLMGCFADAIIYTCWHRGYSSIMQLESEVKRMMADAGMGPGEEIKERSEGWYRERKEECERMVGQGILQECDPARYIPKGSRGGK